MTRSTLILCLAVLGCAGPRSWTGRGDPVFRIAHQRDVSPSFVRAGEKLLAGFPERFPEHSFRVGDKLLYGFESYDGDEVTRYFVVLETERSDPATKALWLDTRKGLMRHIESPVAVVRVAIYDEARSLLAEQTSSVVTLLHEAGLFGWARMGGAHPLQSDKLRFLDSPKSLPPHELSDKRFGWPVTLELFREFANNGALIDLLSGLSVWPAWYEGIGLIGAKIVLHDGLSWARLVRQPIPDLPAGDLAYETRIVLTHHREPLLVVHAVLVPPVGPLAMAAGMITLTGYRGDDPSRRFVARLLAARVGG